jgi:hypothetical protein
MSSARLYFAGRVSAVLTILCVLIVLLIGAMAISKMHPPRTMDLGPKTSLLFRAPELRELDVNKRWVSQIS